MKKFNKRSLVFLSLLVVGLMLFAGCQKKVGTLIVKVDGPDSAQVTVENGKSATKTGSSVQFDEVPAGEYTVIVESEGYETVEKAITVKGGETNTVPVTLEKKETETSQSDETEQEMYNVLVNLLDPSGKKVTGTATITGEGKTFTKQAENGVLTFEAAPGEYKIKVETEGYKVVEKTITVGNQDQEMDVTMEPKQVDLSLQIVDSNNNPLTATIFLKTDDEVKQMKEDSQATFKGVKAGEYTLEILRDGYKDTVKEVNLTGNEEMKVVMRGGHIQQYLFNQDGQKATFTIKDLASDQEAIIAASYANMDQAPEGFEMDDLEYKARQRGLELIKEYGADFKLTEPNYSLGDTKEFAISDDVKEGKVTATLEAKGDHIYVFVDNNEQVSQAKLDKLVTNFDDNIYPRVTINPNDKDKVAVLLTEFDKAEKTKPHVTGFFDPADLYPGAGNQHPMFYLNSTRPKNTMLTAAAHQYQHLVFFVTKARMNRTANDAWIDQGLAHLSSQLCGYINFEKRGWSDEKANGWVYDEEYGYLHNTDKVNVLYHDGSLPFTGSAALMTHYLIEQYGPELIREIMTNSNDPVKVIENYTGQPFEQIYANWMTANVADNISAIDNEVYNYSSFDLNMMPDFNKGNLSKTGVVYFKISGTGGDMTIPLPDDLKDDLIITVTKKDK